MLGLAGVASCIQFEDSRPAKAYLIPRNDAGRPRTDIDVDPHFSFHFVSTSYDPSCLLACLRVGGWARFC